VKIQKKARTNWFTWGIRVGVLLVATLLLSGVYGVVQSGANQIVERPSQYKQVIIELNNADYVDITEPDIIVDLQQNVIESAREKLYRQIAGLSCYIELVREYDNFPLIAFSVDSTCESYLKMNPLVSRVSENRQYEPQAFDYSSPIDIIDGSIEEGFSDGTNTYSGAGQAIVIIDSGVDKHHPALQGKVIAEACFGSNRIIPLTDMITGDDVPGYVRSLCPDGVEFSDAEDSGLDCSYLLPDDCGHGTMVAAAAVMSYHTYTSPSSGDMAKLRGVATETKIVAIQIDTVVALSEDGDEYIGTALFDSEILAALDYVATHDFPLPIAAVNMSFGGGLSHEGFCDGSDAIFAEVFSILRQKGIAPIVAAGNGGEYERNVISPPGCVESAVTVAAVNNNGARLTDYTNNGRAVDLAAPGGEGGWPEYEGGMVLPLATTTEYVKTSGTSFAAPTTAGAFAVLREKAPDASVDELEAILQSTGAPIFDDRDGFWPSEKPLIQVNKALAALDDRTAVRVSKIEISKSSAKWDVANRTRSFDLSAAVYGLNNPSQDVTWSITGNLSSDTTIDSTGHVVMSLNETGDVTVIATSVADSTKKAFLIVGELEVNELKEGDFDPEDEEFITQHTLSPGSIFCTPNLIEPGKSYKCSMDPQVDIGYEAIKPYIKVEWTLEIRSWEACTTEGEPDTTINASGVLYISAQESIGKNICVYATVKGRYEGSIMHIASILPIEIGENTHKLEVTCYRYSYDKYPMMACSAASNINHTFVNSQPIIWSVLGASSTSTVISGDDWGGHWAWLTFGPDEENIEFTVRAALSEYSDVYGEYTYIAYDCNKFPETCDTVVNVTVWPSFASVVQGGTEQFWAEVERENFFLDPGQGLTWSISGNEKPGTTINDGLLTVAVDETADEIIVMATYLSKVGMATVTIVKVNTPIQGDIDGDGAVTMIDAMLIAQAVVGSGGLTPAQRAIADMDGDGVLTMADVVMIMRKAAGMS